MNTSKPIQYLILASIVFTIPAHSKNLFNYCADAYQLTKQSVVDVVNGQATTETKIGVGLAALVITYALIKYAIYKRDEAFLKKRGIDIKYVNGDMQHLKKAVEENDIPLIRMLLKHGAAIHNACYLNKSESEFSPLEVAIKRDPKLVELLLKKAKNINQELLGSALFFVIREDHSNTNKNIELLLQYDPRITPEIGEVTLSIAAERNHTALDFLIQYGKSTGKLNQRHLDRALFSSIGGSKHIGCKNVALFIKYGADINAKVPYLPNKKLQTPLTYAITIGAIFTVRFLLKKGAQIEVEEGISAYDYHYFEDEDISDLSKQCEHIRARLRMRTRLDNHRRDLAKKYRPEVRLAVYTHLPQDPTGIVMQYVDPVYYPLMRERPLKSFEHDDNDGTKEAIAYAKVVGRWCADDNN